MSREIRANPQIASLSAMLTVWEIVIIEWRMKSPLAMTALKEGDQLEEGGRGNLAMEMRTELPSTLTG